MKILLHLPPAMIDHCFSATDLRCLSENNEVFVPVAADKLEHQFLEKANQCEAVVTGWDTPPLTDELLDAASHLKLVVHAAGSVKALLPQSVWRRGIRVAGCNAALAVGVAETTLGFIICGLKGFFPARDWTKAGGWHDPKLGTKTTVIREPFRQTIGIVGASQVGRQLIRLLQAFEMEILVYDPYLCDEEAARLGVRATSLHELCIHSDVVTLHAPLLPSTHHLLGSQHFAAMKDNAIFINTARGALVDEAALITELQSGRLFAFIDVTDPEPPDAAHPFRHMSNVVLTPHIAGHASNGARRQGCLAVQQLLAFNAGLPIPGEITLEQWERMA